MPCIVISLHELKLGASVEVIVYYCKCSGEEVVGSHGKGYPGYRGPTFNFVWEYPKKEWLRERKEDIPELAQVFLKKYVAKTGKPVHSISPDAMKALQNWRWPGNVRELEHQIERAVTLTSGSILAADDFELTGEVPGSPAEVPGQGEDQKSLEEMERIHILKVLKDVDYNKSRASEVLGIDRATLYRKAQKYGIPLKNE